MRLPLVLSLALVGCASGSSRPAPPPGYAPGPGQAPGYAPAQGPQAGGAPGPRFLRPAPQYTAPLYLPGVSGAQPVTFKVIDGMAVHQGDVLLGHVSQLGIRYGRPKAASGPAGVSYATAVKHDDDLWPGGVIPYVFDSSLKPQDHPKLQAAIDRMNQTALTMRPATAADPDKVVFVDHGKGCYSFYGRVGGAQDCHVGGCSTSTMMHEILHAAGFYHEQARPDRDQYVTIMWDEIVDGEESNFKLQTGARTFGGYDYGSIMHYRAKAFSKSGKPTIVSKTPGVQLGGAKDLTPTDIAGIAELYGSAPPPGTTPPGTTPPGTTGQPPTWAEILGLPTGQPGQPGQPGMPAWPQIPGLPTPQGLPAGLPPWPVLSTQPAPPGLPPIPHVFW